MFSWNDVYARQEHADDLRREAEQERRAHQMLDSNTGRSSRLNHRLLMKLGDRLINWGLRLQKHGAADWQLAFQPRPRIDRGQPCPGGNG